MIAVPYATQLLQQLFLLFSEMQILALRKEYRDEERHQDHPSPRVYRAAVTHF
jgi:hypothetical protein